MLRGRFVKALSIKCNGNIFSLHMIANDKANLFVRSVLLVANFFRSQEVFYHHSCALILTHEEEGMT